MEIEVGNLYISHRSKDIVQVAATIPSHITDEWNIVEVKVIHDPNGRWTDPPKLIVSGMFLLYYVPYVCSNKELLRAIYTD